MYISPLETRLFKILTEQQQPTNAELARRTNVDPVLMKRLLRYYQSFGMIDQPSDDYALVSPGGRAGVPFHMETLVPAFNALPGVLRQTNYANITEGANCPWHLGHKTDRQAFEWVKERPSILGHFISWMVSQHEGYPIFLDVVDFEKKFAVQNANDPVFVDVRGAMGHQLELTHYPALGGIETQSHDFFALQPVKGARAYYLRNVLHDWPDHKCVEILQNNKCAMTEDSRILIDEMVLFEHGASWRATRVDLAMSTCFAAMGRSRTDWDALLGKAGLTISKLWRYTDEVDGCIIVAVLS
ncbi:S-adenosyl-L-methionine-dependent methyltransferase [Xylaria arbuscula]|nr:S-adenosyl-L-methionine-dependent methyltransferase [Xylaria arbuscula]